MSGGGEQTSKDEGTSKGSGDAGGSGKEAPNDKIGGSGDRAGEGGNGGGRTGSDTQASSVDSDGFGNPHRTTVTVEFNMGKPLSPNLQRIKLERYMKV
jgi:hypothetical protein